MSISDKSKIEKTEVSSHDITLTLGNGVQVHISSHDDHLHFHFSGTDLPLICSSNSFLSTDPETQELKLSNCANLFYEPRVS